METLNHIQTYDEISVSPKGITMYRKPITPHRHHTDDTEEPIIKAAPKRIIKPQGYMSDFSCRKLRKALEWLILISSKKKQWSKSAKKWVQFKVTFITLTLPSDQRHTDQIVKSKCLNSLLIELRKFHGMKNYIWRAEKQVNGNIHFHLVTDCFIDAQKLRERWNRICNVLGYTDAYTARMRNNIKSFSDYYNTYINQGSYASLMRRYNHGRATNWSDPNSTDIHSVRKIHNLTAYLFKYMSKNVENVNELTEAEKDTLLVKGQIWGLSESLSQIKNVTIPIDSYIRDEINRIYHEIKSYEKQDDFFHFKAINIRTIFRLKCTEIMTHIIDKLNEVFQLNVIAL